MVALSAEEELGLSGEVREEVRHCAWRVGSGLSYIRQVQSILPNYIGWLTISAIYAANLDIIGIYMIAVAVPIRLWDNVTMYVEWR